jgi:hypothetical protein
MELQVQNEELTEVLQDSAVEKWKQAFVQVGVDVVEGERYVQVGSATQSDEEEDEGYLMSQRSKHFLAETLQKQEEDFCEQLEGEAKRSQET